MIKHSPHFQQKDNTGVEFYIFVKFSLVKNIFWGYHPAKLIQKGNEICHLWHFYKRY